MDIVRWNIWRKAPHDYDIFPFDPIFGKILYNILTKVFVTMNCHFILIMLSFFAIATKMSMASDLSDPREIVSDALAKFSLNEIDYDWLIYRNCETHGRSCPCLGTVTQISSPYMPSWKKMRKKLTDLSTIIITLGYWWSESNNKIISIRNLYQRREKAHSPWLQSRRFN